MQTDNCSFPCDSEICTSYPSFAYIATAYVLRQQECVYNPQTFSSVCVDSNALNYCQTTCTQQCVIVSANQIDCVCKYSGAYPNCTGTKYLVL